MKAGRILNIVSLMLLTGSTTVGRAEIVLQNEACSLTLEERGGGITSLVLSENPVNPLSWGLTPEDMPANNRKGAPFSGHFICIGRWGDPTPGETSLGMPNNGDVAALTWHTDTANSKFAAISCSSDLDYTDVEREISLDAHAPVYLVKDRVKNRATIGRLFNVVQHATLGAPFLSEETLVSTNAGRGFMQDNYLPSPEENSYCWPFGRLADGNREVDLRRSDGKDSYVSSHVFTDSIGWVTAISPSERLMTGYIWKTDEYPWLNVWHQIKDGAPWAKGLEFGTTGLGAPYNELLNMKSEFFNNTSYFFFDADGELEKHFIGFIVRIPEDFGNAESLTVNDDRITVVGTDGVRVELETDLLKQL